MWVFRLHICLCTVYTWCPQRPEGVGSSGIVATDDYQLSRGFWETKLIPLEEQPVHLPRLMIYLIYFKLHSCVLHGSVNIYMGTFGGHRLYSLELELQALGSHPTWLLETEFCLCVRYILNPLTISHFYLKTLNLKGLQQYLFYGTKDLFICSTKQFVQHLIHLKKCWEVCVCGYFLC